MLKMDFGLIAKTLLVLQILILIESANSEFPLCQINEKCVRRYLCPHMYDFFLDSEMSGIQCGIDHRAKSTDQRIYVCCPEPGNVLPNERICGQGPPVQKIMHGDEARLNEMPWIALLLYHNPWTKCAGSLINSRYVLTAAHCVDRDDVRAIRLGEHDTSTEDDYGMQINGLRSWAPNPLEVEVEKSIIHPDFNWHHLRNDIALLRLKLPVRYTPAISPICLLGRHISLEPYSVAAEYKIAGWGYTERDRGSNVLLKTNIMRVHHVKCNRKHKLLQETQICAGGQWGRDTCKGDSGGPLMASLGKDFVYLAGITSYAPSKCGQPGVYTKTESFIYWIKYMLRP